MATGTWCVSYVSVYCGMRNGGFVHRNVRCGSRARRVTGTGTRECMFEVKTVERHSPAEPQHMKNDLLQSLVRVGVSFLLFHVLPSDSMHLPELASEKSPESASCEKRWYRPSEYALWERSSKNQRRWSRTHHPIETDCTVNVLRVEKGLFVVLLMACGIGRNEDLVWGRDSKVHIRSEDRGASQPCGAAELELQFAGSGARWPLLLVDACCPGFRCLVPNG